MPGINSASKQPFVKTCVHVVPLFVVLQIPTFEKAIIVVGVVGLIKSFLIVLPWFGVHASPVVFHVVPPSVDFKTPVE